MTTKTISVMQDVYDLLRSIRREGESFSETIRRTLKRKRSILEFAGAWKHMTEKEVEEIKANIRRLRNQSTQNLLRRADLS